MEESATQVKDRTNMRYFEIRGKSSVTQKISKKFLKRQKHRKIVDALEPSFYLHAYKLKNNGEFLWDDGTDWSTRVWEYKLRPARFNSDHWEGTLEEDRHIAY